MTDFQAEWDDLTYRLVEAFIDDDSGEVNQLVGEAAQHPDLIAVLINLGHLAAGLALAGRSSAAVSLRLRYRPTDDPALTDEDVKRRVSGAKRDVEDLMRLGGAD